MDLFSLLIGLGATIGLIWVAYLSPGQQAHRNVDAGIAALFGALVGGRAVFVAINWGYYQAHLVELPEVWKGGISGIGALAGSIAALVLLSVFVRPGVGELADALLPLVVTMTSAAWMGCWFDGCAYGAQVNGWWGLPSRDEWGIVLHRVPVQLIGAVLTLLLFWSVERLTFRMPVAGQPASLALLLLALEFFGLSFLRADPIPYWRGMRLDAWGALGLAGLAAIYLAYALLRAWLVSRKRKRKLTVAEAYEGR